MNIKIFLYSILSCFLRKGQARKKRLFHRIQISEIDENLRCLAKYREELFSTSVTKHLECRIAENIDHNNRHRLERNRVLHVQERL